MRKLSKRLLISLLIISMLSTNMMSISFAATDQIQNTMGEDTEEENSVVIPEDISGHWAEKEMIEMFLKGYFKGYDDGLSHPEYNITRAQVVTILNQLLGLSFDKSMDYGEEFKDVNESDWFYADVMLAKENGYILGYDDKTFKPNQEMTRFEIVQLLSRLLEEKEITEETNFTDEDTFPSWVRPAMKIVKSFKLFNGFKDGSFRGDQSMTRGEWFAVLYRGEQNIKNGTEVEDIAEVETGTSTGTTTSTGGSKPISNVVELISMTPNEGEIGTEIEIIGKNITSNNDELKLYFKGSNSGLREVSYTNNFNNKITLFAEFMEIESYQVYVVSEGKISNSLSFTAKALDVEVNPTATPEFVAAVEKLNNGVKHEIGVVFLDQAFFDKLPAEDKDSLTEINKAVEDLSQELQSMLTNYEGLSDEGQQLLNTLMSTDLFSQTGAELEAATELLSHSSTSEALDNIRTATKSIRDVRDKIQWVKTTLQIFIAGVETGAIISDIFGFGAGVALHTIASAASDILTTIVNPVLVVLDIIIFLLDVMPSNAVKDSFQTKVVSDNIGIDENFGSIAEILGDQRADNILERDLATLLAYNIRTITELNLLLSHKTQGININASNAIDIVAESFDLSTKLTNMLESTQNVISAAYENPEYFYAHRADYETYLNEMDEYVEIYRGYLQKVMEFSTLQSPYSGNLIVEIKKINNTAIYGLEIAINNLRYTFEKDYDPILFRSPELEEARVDSAGVIYIDKPVKIIGTMDFSGESNTQMIFEHGTDRMMVEAGVSPLGSIESLLSGTIQDFMFGIVDKFIDFDVDLEDVEVKLSFETSDDSILSGYWDGDELVIQGHKPGLVEATVRADIEQVRNGEIEEEYAMIKRDFLVLSGDQLNEPFSEGPRIDSVLNEDGEEISSAYIGDTITVEGKGFSRMASSYQNLYFGSLPIYNELGLTEFMSQATYNSFDAEVPDSFGDSIKVVVGPDQDTTPTQMDKWPSDVQSFNVLPTELHEVHPTGIVGESWPVIGRGFSHYALRNDGLFNDLQEDPGVTPQSYKGLFQPASDNTLNHDYHDQLDFIFPAGTTDGLFKIITDGVYETASYPYTTHTLSSPIQLNGDNEGIRPNYVVNDMTGDGLAAWYDVNASGGMQLISAFASRQDASFDDYAIVSDNIGGIPTAPDEFGLDVNASVYGIGWIGQGASGNDVFFSSSTDGKIWSQGINVSSSSNSSSSPEVGVVDIDQDGDQDFLVLWTENPQVESDQSAVKMATLTNDNGNFSVETRIISSQNASEVSMDLYDNYLAVTWSEETVSPYTKNVRGIFGSLENGLFTNQKNFVVSENSGYSAYASMYEDSLDHLRIYKTAGNSDVAIGMDSDTHEPNIYIAWENYAKTTKDNVEFRNEDIFFRVVPSAGDMGEIQNITNSIKSSQTPKVTVDGDDTPTLTFIETGYEDHKYFRDEGFKTEVYFARSFDNGKSFNKPFIKVDSNQDAQRIGHIQMDGARAADYGIIYQYESEGKQEIRFCSTQDIRSVEANTLENTVEQQSGKFIMRTYSSGSYSGALLSVNEHPNGDVIISKEDNSDLMRIVRNHSVVGNVSASPDGKYISYGQEDLMVAEADGSHPIRIFIGEWEYTALDAMWSPSGNYIAYHGIGEMSGYSEGQGGTSYVDSNGLSFGGIGDLNSATDTPWGYINGTEVLVVKQKDDWDGSGIMIVEPNGGFRRYTDDDMLRVWPAITLDGKYMAVVESDDRDRYDYGNLYLNTLETGIKTQLTSNGGLPVFSPDSQYIAYYVLSGGMRKIKIEGLGNSDFSVLIDDGTNLYQPVFNSDSSRLYFNEKNSVNGAVILKYYDLVNEQVYTMGATSGASGKADLMTFTSDMLIKDSTLYVVEGENTSFGLRLAKMPTQDVTVNVVPSSSLLQLDQDALVFNSTNWNTDQSIVVSVADDDEDNGTQLHELRFIISSDDDNYKNGNSINSRVYVTDNDSSDAIDPEWEEESYIHFEAFGTNQVKATWPQGTDNVGVTRYRVILKDADQNTIYDDFVTEQIFTSEALVPAATYKLKVFALDAVGNTSEELSAFYTLNDTNNPYFNSEDTISISYLSGNEAEIIWPEAHDDNVINRYNVYLDEVLIGSTSERRYAKTGLSGDTTYTLSVRAVDSSENLGTRIGITFATYSEDDFYQGVGYYDGTYLHGAIQPSYNQWNGVSRFPAPTNIGISFALDEYGETSPVIDAEGNIYTTNASSQLTKLDRDGNFIWVNESAVVQGEIILHQNHVYFVDGQGGVSICNYSLGESVGRYVLADCDAEEIMGIDRDNNLILKVLQYVTDEGAENYDCILLVDVDFEASIQFNIIRRIPISWEFENYVLDDDGWVYFIDIYSNFLGYNLYSPNDTYHYGGEYYKERSINNVVLAEPNINLRISKMLSGTNANRDLFLYQKNYEYGSRRFISGFDTEGVFSIDDGMNINEIKWQTEINGSLTSTKVTCTEDGKLIATGYSGVSSAYMVCIDTNNGDLLWDRSFAGYNFTDKRAVVDKDGNIYIVDNGGTLFTLNMDGDLVGEIDIATGVDATFSMPIIGNNAIYLTHNGLVKLSDPEGGEFSVADYTMVREEVGTALIPIRLDGNDSGVRYIHYKTESLTGLGYDAAQSDTIWNTLDYAPSEGYLSFGPGERVKYAEITIHNDTYYETYEPFRFVIDEAVGGATLNDDQDTMTIGIRDDDYQNPLGFTFTSRIVDEADGSIELTVSRNSEGSLKACSVDYRIESAGTPAEDGYVDQSGTLEFAKGDHSKSIIVTLVDDNIYVPGKSFDVILENPRLVDLDSSADRTTIEIDDSDNLPSVEFEQSTNIEDIEEARTYTFTIERENTTGSTIALETTGTATYGTDYTSSLDLSKLVMIDFDGEALSKTFTITIINDNDGEPKETINLELVKNKFTDLEPGANKEFEIAIVDDDAFLPRAPIANGYKNGIESVDFYHLIVGAELNIYNAAGTIVETIASVPRDYWPVSIGESGDGYYAIQSVAGIESLPSNTFSLSDVERDAMELTTASAYAGPYTFVIGEIALSSGEEYTTISVNETFTDNRKIFYSQSSYGSIELKEGSVLADLGYDVSPDWEDYKNTGRLMKEGNPDNKIYYFVTKESDLLSEVLYYGEVK